MARITFELEDKKAIKLKKLLAENQKSIKTFGNEMVDALINFNDKEQEDKDNAFWDRINDKPGIV